MDWPAKGRGQKQNEIVPRKLNCYSGGSAGIDDLTKFGVTKLRRDGETGASFQRAERWAGSAVDLTWLARYERKSERANERKKMYV